MIVPSLSALFPSSCTQFTSNDDPFLRAEFVDELSKVMIFFRRPGSFSCSRLGDHPPPFHTVLLVVFSI